MAVTFSGWNSSTSEIDEKIGTPTTSGATIFKLLENLGNSLTNLVSSFTSHIANWTAARAAKLDNLDTTVSSRAPSNTALSNTVWTNTRAGYLDKLNSGITVSSLSGKIVKRIQRGIANPPSGNSYSATGNITITAVNMNKAIVICSGGETAFARLTSATNIQYCTYSTSYKMAWEVIEFY